jgi:TATA-box binding protein (TBP) (component of TFIID and TFIIIB)
LILGLKELSDRMAIYIKEPCIGMINYIGTLSTPINLMELYAKFEPDEVIIGIRVGENIKGEMPIDKNKKRAKMRKKQEFYNSVSLLVKYNKNFKIKIFNSGKVQIPGCKSFDDANYLINAIIDKINDLTDDDDICNTYDLIPVIYDDNKMVTYQYKLNLDDKYINLPELLTLITVQYKLFAIYIPERHPALNIKYVFPNDPRKVTILVYADGIVSLKGSNTMEKNQITHDFINKIIFDFIKE